MLARLLNVVSRTLRNYLGVRVRARVIFQMREEDPDEPDWMVVPAAELEIEQSSQSIQQVGFVNRHRLV